MRMTLLLLMAQIANAESTTQPCDHARAIYPAIAAKSIASEIRAKGDECVLTWKPKPGQTITFVDDQTRRAPLKAEINALETKLDDGTITPSETRRLLKIMLILSRVSKDA